MASERSSRLREGGRGLWSFGGGGGESTTTSAGGLMSFADWWVLADDRCRRECPYEQVTIANVCDQQVCWGCPGCEHSSSETTGTVSATSTTLSMTATTRITATTASITRSMTTSSAPSSTSSATTGTTLGTTATTASITRSMTTSSAPSSTSSATTGTTLGITATTSTTASITRSMTTSSAPSSTSSATTGTTLGITATTATTASITRSMTTPRAPSSTSSSATTLSVTATTSTTASITRSMTTSSGTATASSMTSETASAAGTTETSTMTATTSTTSTTPTTWALADQRHTESTLSMTTTTGATPNNGSQADFGSWWALADARCRMECPYGQATIADVCVLEACWGCPGCEYTNTTSGAPSSTSSSATTTTALAFSTTETPLGMSATTSTTMDFGSWWAQADERCRRECPYGQATIADPCALQACWGCPGCEYTNTTPSVAPGAGTTPAIVAPGTATSTSTASIGGSASATASAESTTAASQTTVIIKPVPGAGAHAPGTQTITQAFSTTVGRTGTGTSETSVAVSSDTESSSTSNTDSSGTTTLTTETSSGTAASDTATDTNTTTAMPVISFGTTAEPTSFFLGGGDSSRSPLVASALLAVGAILAMLLCCLCCFRRRRNRMVEQQRAAAKGHDLEAIKEAIPDALDPRCFPLGADPKHANYGRLEVRKPKIIGHGGGGDFQGVADEAPSPPRTPESMPAFVTAADGPWDERRSTTDRHTQTFRHLSDLRGARDVWRFRHLSDLPGDSPRRERHRQRVVSSGETSQGFLWESGTASAASIQRAPAPNTRPRADFLEAGGQTVAAQGRWASFHEEYGTPRSSAPPSATGGPQGPGPGADFLDGGYRRSSASQSQPRATYSEAHFSSEQRFDTSGAWPQHGPIAPAAADRLLAAGGAGDNGGGRHKSLPDGLVRDLNADEPPARKQLQTARPGPSSSAGRELRPTCARMGVPA